MEIWPAVDIRGGNAVRLEQGDYARETVFGTPMDFAAKWVQKGARNLHLVDLDGAKQGYPVNTDIVGKICSSNPVNIIFWIYWHIKINDMRNIFDIDASSCNIRCN